MTRDSLLDDALIVHPNGDPLMTERDDRQDIFDVLIRYATGIDRRDWSLFRAVFTDDCILDYGEIGVWNEVVPGLVEVEVAVPRSRPAVW
jgi:SnoaL-like domain